MTPRLSLAELADAAGMSKPQLRKWIEFGVIPPSLGRGRGRYFTPDHLKQLRKAQRERANCAHLARRVSLPMIGEYLRDG